MFIFGIFVTERWRDVSGTNSFSSHSAHFSLSEHTCSLELHRVNATETSAPHATLLLASSDKYLGSDPACGTVSALTQSNRKCWARSGHQRLSSGWYAVCFLSKWAKNRKDFRHHLLIWETTALFFFWQWFRGTLLCLSYFFSGRRNPFVSIIYSLNAHNVSVRFSPVAVVCQREYKPDNVTSSIHLFLPALLTVNPSAACVFQKSYFPNTFKNSIGFTTD